MTSIHYDSIIGYLQIRHGTFTLTVCKSSVLFNNSVGKCCLHSFYYINSIYFHCSASIPYHGQKANWLYQEWKFPGTFVPGNKSSQWEHSFPERKFPGTFIPGSEGSHWQLSLRGAKILGSEKSWYHLHTISLSDNYILSM